MNAPSSQPPPETPPPPEGALLAHGHAGPPPGAAPPEGAPPGYGYAGQVAYTPYRGAQAKAPPRPARVTPARPRELIALLLFVVLADLLLFAGGGGYAQALFFGASSVLLLLFARARRFSVRLVVIGTLLLAVSTRVAWESSVGGLALSAFLLVAFAVALRVKRSFMPELLTSFLFTLTGSFSRLGAIFVGLKNLRGRRDKPGFEWLSVLVPVGVVAVFATVFTVANPVLEKWVLSALGHVSVPAPLRILFWLASLLAGAALLRPAFRRIGVAALGRHELADSGEGCVDSHIRMARNTLLGLNALFFLENALDAVALWGGHPPAGLGYTEYARHGTAWLTFALVLSTVVIGFVFRGPFHFDPKARVVKTLAYVWAGQNAILAVGTFRRIFMYVDVSGLTTLRILGIYGSALVVVGLAIVVLMVARRRSGAWLLHRQLDAFGIALALFVATPTGLVSAEFNASRVRAGQYAPLLHLFEQRIQAENIPGVASLLEHKDPLIARGTAALLAREEERLTAEADKTSLFLEREASLGLALRTLHARRERIESLSPSAARQDDLNALRKLAGLANENEEAFDYRGRGGVRSRGDSF